MGGGHPSTSSCGGRGRRRSHLGFLAAACLLLLGLLGFHASGARAEESRKVSVSEVVFDSPVDDIQWAGHDFSSVLVRTTGGHIFASHDNGKTWDEISHIFNANSAGNSESLVESILVSPVDRNIVLVVGSHHSHYVSDNAGRSFHRVEMKAPVHNWVFHPKDAHWALLSTWTEACTRAGGRGKDDLHCNHLLYVTTDLGRTFRLIATYVVQYSWGDLKLNQQDRVYFTHHRNKSGHQNRSPGWSGSVDFSYADVPHRGNAASHVMLLRGGNKFLVSNGYIFVARLESEEAQTVNLLVSTDGAATFAVAKLPTPLMQKSFTILDTSEGAVMIHVNHGETHSNTGNVYISDAKGVRYSLSLPNNVRTASGESEFDRVAWADGIYMANFKDTNYLTPAHERHDDGEYIDWEDELEEWEQEEEEMSALQTDIDRRKRKHSKLEEPIRTVVSFDKGGEWRYLKAPARDSLGNDIHCANPSRCWLHLHGISHFHHFAPFYSVENGPSVIIGTGNVGSQLRFEPGEVNTYITEDGGLSWSEAHRGAYIYEFGNHGGLIVMADDSKKTNQVVFTWDRGSTWYDFELGPEEVEVDNIVIEPNSSSVEFLLYGTRGDAGILYHLDFAALQQPLCKGVWAPDSVSSDYETWSPAANKEGEGCLLGRHVVYTRRKKTSQCFNEKGFANPLFKHNCACSPEDYECEFGFMRHVEGTHCVPDMHSPDILIPQCRTGKAYLAHAYRRVPGDTCEGGWQPEKVAVPCPPHSPLSVGAWTVLGALFLCVLFVAFMSWLAKNPEVTAGFLNFGFESFRNVQYTVLGGAGGGGKGKKKAQSPSGKGGVYEFARMDDDEDDNDFAEEDDDDDDAEFGGSGMTAYTQRRTSGSRGADKRKGEHRSRGARDGGKSELGFIESAQEEHEDDAPTLMAYKYSYRDDVSDDENDILGMGSSSKGGSPSKPQSSDGGAASRQRGALSVASESVPRLAPPPGGSSRVGTSSGNDPLV